MAVQLIDAHRLCRRFFVAAKTPSRRPLHPMVRRLSETPPPADPRIADGTGVVDANAPGPGHHDAPKNHRSQLHGSDSGAAFALQTGANASPAPSAKLGARSLDIARSRGRQRIA